MAAVLLIGSIEVVFCTFSVYPVQENKSAVLPLKFSSSVPLPEWQLVAKNFPKNEEESYQHKYSNKQKNIEIKASYRQYDGANVSRLFFK